MRKLAYISIIKAILLLVFVSGSGLYAQRPLEIDEIQVVAPYEPSISDAFKININPVIEDTMTVAMDFNYTIQPKKIITRFAPEQLTPARMRGEPLPRLYKGLVKAGYGSYQTPYFEGFYNTLRSNEYALGVHLKHRSSGKDIDHYEHSTYSTNTANLYGTRFFRNTSLDGQVLFNRDVVRYYGMSELFDGVSKVFPDINTWGDRQRFDFLSSRLSFGTHHSDSLKTRMQFGLDHYWLADRYDATEHRFGGHARIGKETGGNNLRLASKLYLELDLSAEYFYNERNYGITHYDHSGIYKAEPKVYAEYTHLNLELGANISVEDNNGSYNMRAWPLARVEASVIPQRLVFYMGLQGGLERQSLRQLTQTNPFMNTTSELTFSNLRSEVSGGMKGSVRDIVSFDFSVSNSKIDNYPIFMTGIWPSMPPLSFDSRFLVFYDDISLLNLRGSIQSRFGERLSLGLTGNYFDYDLKVLSRALHKPSYTLEFNARYNIQDKIILHADLIGRGETWGQKLISTGHPPVKHKLYDFVLDSNVGIEYRYTRILSVFLNFYNIQNETYEMWSFYPTQGFGFLGGVSYAF